ncbi:MAG: hypothetical protein KGH99_07085 [Thaumarchaeota archaeon]|nr:hypothetical protein [Nitrososphaerota archaeon]
MEQSGDEKTKTLVQIGHENFFKYPFSQNTRRVRFHGKRTEKELVYFKIKDLIDEGITSTGELALRLGKSTRQTRRYLKNGTPSNGKTRRKIGQITKGRNQLSLPVKRSIFKNPGDIEMD